MKSVTIAITIALILFTYNTWEDYQIKNKDSLRQVVIENVERVRNCRKPQNGYKVYQCPECGTKAANQWADQIYQKLLKVPHRHVVFTIPERLRELLRDSKFLKILFLASKETMEELLVQSNEKKDAWSMARYIGRYIKHPPIAESRIIAYDGKQVTFWYRDSETDQKITVTMDKFEFVGLLLSHIPEKNFKLVRYIGIYSRRGYRHTQTEFHDAVIVIIKRSWREEIKKTFEYDPLICPHCNTEMELIGICYEGTANYPTDDPQPVKPPPNIKFSQQERMQLIVSLIIENQNGRGASIEKVVSEAVMRGIDKEQLLSDIQHMKDRGEVFEPKKDEIRYAF